MSTGRFSRRTGEAYRGCEYAQSIEIPAPGRRRGMAIVAALLAAFLITSALHLAC